MEGSSQRRANPFRAPIFSSRYSARRLLILVIGRGSPQSLTSEELAIIIAWQHKGLLRCPHSVKTPRKSQASAGVSIAGLLSKDLIRINLPQREKRGMMEYLTRELCTVKSLADPTSLLGEITKREEGVPTTLDTGLSIPHA